MARAPLTSAFRPYTRNTWPEKIMQTASSALPFVAPRSAANGAPSLTQPVQSKNAALANTGRNLWHLVEAPEPVAIYVHLPFCKQKCFYCDFPVLALGDQQESMLTRRFEDYVRLLCTEIKLHKVLHTIHEHFGIAPGAEVTLEADPGTFDLQSLQNWQQLGINRFSVGIQSFDDALLTTCGRSHTKAEALAALGAIQQADPRSWSLDLISGLPGLTQATWEASLELAIDAEPDHISIYDLQVEARTPFQRWQESGKLVMPCDAAAADMYSAACGRLVATGYEHYEVSSFARPGCRSRHNQAYWHGHSYYAFGLGAASFLQRRRFSRPRKMADWRRYVDALSDSCRANGEYCAGTSESPLSQEDRLLESVMLLLRTAEGVSLAWFCAAFGHDRALQLMQALHRHHACGLVKLCLLGGSEPSWDAALEWLRDGCTADSGDLSVRLTDPEGFLLSNTILTDVFASFG